MLSSVALRAQIASVIDALSEAAVAEVARLVEDGMVVLRLQLRQRETEIHKLRSGFELLRGELRALRGGAGPGPDGGRHDAQRAVGEERTSLENGSLDKNRSGPSRPEPPAPVKCEPAEEGSEENREDASSCGQWRPAGRGDSGSSHLGRSSASPLNGAPSAGFPPSPFIRGLPGYGQYRGPYGAARRRANAAAKRLVLRKGFSCPYCGKYFERGGHLERHKRIHTGEKPYGCEECGRRFNQNCSLKEHRKTHGRGAAGKTGRSASVGDEGIEPAPDTRRLLCVLLPGAREAEPAGNRGNAADDVVVPPEKEDLAAAPVRVKREPAEEDIAPRGGGLSESFATFVSDGQQWMSRSDLGGVEFLGGGVPAAHCMASDPGVAPPLPPAVDASCSTFSFPGTPYGEPGGAACGRSDPRGSRSFLPMKPRKCFSCSYCGKAFERVGHLERHLRIHTGEKPYGCQVCGRCFNQKSSLKGHMKTHRAEGADAPESSRLMFTAPEEPYLGGGGAYGEAGGERTVMVKLEPGGEELHAAAGRSRPWSAGGADGEYRLGAGGERRGCTPPAAETPFLHAKVREEEASHAAPYSGLEPPDRRLLSPEETLADEYSAAMLNSNLAVSAEFEFNMAAADNCGAVGGGQNCFICSTCGRSFDCFDSFQEHRCDDGAAFS